jgi:hypothetical protein
MWMIFILLFQGIKELISMHVDDFYFILRNQGINSFEKPSEAIAHAICHSLSKNKSISGNSYLNGAQNWQSHSRYNLRLHFLFERKA